MRLPVWLPGISAASQLGLSASDEWPAKGGPADPRADEPLDMPVDEDNSRLPPRDDTFYWALAANRLF